MFGPKLHSIETMSGPAISATSPLLPPYLFLLLLTLSANNLKQPFFVIICFFYHSHFLFPKAATFSSTSLLPTHFQLFLFIIPRTFCAPVGLRKRKNKHRILELEKTTKGIHSKYSNAFKNSPSEKRHTIQFLPQNTSMRYFSNTQRFYKYMIKVTYKVLAFFFFYSIYSICKVSPLHKGSYAYRNHRNRATLRWGHWVRLDYFVGDFNTYTHQSLST